ncbi:hypothetical protein A2U01_0072582, partial [Trifolium medium]|nr:hypothetical protein [Trifolium medium]
MTVFSTVKANYLLPTDIGPMPKPPTPKTLVLLLRALINLVTRFTTLVTVTTTLISSSTTFTTFLVSVSIRLHTILPLPLV